VPRSEIDQRFFDTPYYITPNEPVGQEAFAVIREAMRSKALVALGRIVLSKRASRRTISIASLPWALGSARSSVASCQSASYRNIIDYFRLGFMLGSFRRAVCVAIRRIAALQRGRCAAWPRAPCGY
jgi:hypothetical protein